MWSASSIPRYCGYANVLKKDKPPSEGMIEGGRLGKKFHGFMEQWTKSGQIPPWPDDPDEADYWFVNALSAMSIPSGALAEVAMGLDEQGGYVPVNEPEPHVYAPLDGVSALMTAGRADVVWKSGDTAWVGDYKTGTSAQDPPGRHLQLLALGFAAMGMLSARAMRLGIYFARDARWEWSHRMTRSNGSTGQLFMDLRSKCNMDDKPRPGDWCGSCWERKRCQHAFRGLDGASAAGNMVRLEDL